jgi:RHS repeat-associated protein
VYEVDTAGVQKSVQYTHTCYDLAGDAVRSIAPRANRATISCTDDTVPFLTKTAYDAAHRTITVTDPAGRITRTDYDENDNVVSRTDEAGNVETTAYNQRDLPVKSVQPFTGGTTPRVLTTLLEYDPNGNRSRVITPRAYDASTDKQTFTKYVTSYVYDKVNQLVQTNLPSTGPGDQHYKYMAYDEVGNLVTVTQDVDQDKLSDVPKDLREDRTYFDPTGWILTSENHLDPVLHFDYDASGRQTFRAPEKKDPNSGATVINQTDKQEWHYYVDGMLSERTDGDAQKITYTYDADNVTRSLTDATGADVARQPTMTVQITPDGLDRPAKTRQRRSNETRWKATLSSYDLDNNILQRIDDREEDDTGAQLKAGRQNDYTYDGTDRLTQQVDQGKDTQASTSDDTRITTSYLPQGWELQRTTDKYVPGGSPVWQPKKVQDWTYYDNGQLKTMSTKNGSGTVLESHDLTYTDDDNQYVNGNQTVDTFKRSGPAASCSSATCTARYTYDARDRLKREEISNGSISDYTLKPPGTIEKEVQTGLDPATNTTTTRTTTYHHLGTRLDTVTSNGATNKYHYDTHGNVNCITGDTGTDADCERPNGSLIDYSYDGLDRLTGYQDSANSINTSYEYDALDRQARQEKHGSAGGPTTNFSYLGLSDKVTKEEQLDTGGSVSRTKEYSYDAFGSANGMTDTPTGQSSKSYLYGKDPLGSVSQLIDESGKAAAAYGYKPYGDTDPSLSAGDTNSKNPINPIRFTEKRYDSGSGTIDTGSRRFGPSNQFLQEDRYSGALSDLGLSTDPLTANRYSLAGGNPANFVEVDGHFSIDGLLGDAKDAFNDVAGTVNNAVGDAKDAVGDIAEGAAGVVSDAAKFVWDNKVTFGSIAAGIGCGIATAGTAAAVCAGAVNLAAGAYDAVNECEGGDAGCIAKTAGVSLIPGGRVAKGLEKTAGRLAASQISKHDDLLGDLASKAQRAEGPGHGPVYGTRVHKRFSDEIKALGRDDLHSEVSYLNGKVVPNGTRGSVRLDAVEGRRHAPTAVHDLKTGSAKLTKKRVKTIRSHLPDGYRNIPIKEIRR